MAARYMVALIMSAGGVVVATLLMWVGWTTDDSRFLNAAVALGVTSWISLLVLWVLGRARCMVIAYQNGYRAGRRDANYKLLEDGFWLSAKAESDARRSMGDDESPI
jgi:hypothetical protein